MPHVLSSERGMVVSRLMALLDSADGMKVQVRWKGLPKFEDSLQSLATIFEDVPQMLVRLLDRKNTPRDLAKKVRNILGISGGM